MALTVPYRSLLSAQDRALLSQALYIDSRLDQVSLLAQLRSRPAGMAQRKTPKTQTLGALHAFAREHF